MESKKLKTPPKDSFANFSVACDWLTLASYKFESYALAAAYLMKIDVGKWKTSKWMQYKGSSNGSDLFFGKAKQTNGKDHYVIKISGGTAGSLLPDILVQDWCKAFYATRIDLQKTRTPPTWWKVREMYDWLISEGSVASVIESSTGSTLYIGNRASGRFCRLYEKEFASKLLRLEIELKAGHARRAWELLLEGESVDSLYLTHLNKLPLWTGAYKDYAPGTGKELDIRLAEKKTSNEKQIAWLKSLLPKFSEMLNDHDIGSEVEQIFMSLIETKGTEDNEQ